MSKKYKTLSCVTDSNNRYDINEIKKEKEENKNIHSDDNMRDNEDSENEIIESALEENKLKELEKEKKIIKKENN